MYDIIVVGCGAAGAVFGSYIDSRKYKVLFIDNKGRMNSKKPCGGLLSQDAQKELARLQLSLPKDVLVNPQIFFVHTLDLNIAKSQRYARHYLNLDRQHFDEWLKSMIPETVVFQEGQVVNISEAHGFYQLTYRDTEGKKKSVFAKTLIGADGANSVVRRYLGKDIPQRLAIQEWYVGDSENIYSCLYDKENSDSCSWLISKDNYFIFGGAFPLADGRQRFEKQKKKLQAQNVLPENAMRREACLLLKPEKWKDFYCGCDNAFLIGEAAGFISASSFEGISYAIRSAYLLAKAFEQNDVIKEYRKNTRSLRIKLYSKIFKAKILDSQFCRSIILRSGFLSLRNETGQKRFPVLKSLTFNNSQK